MSDERQRVHELIDRLRPTQLTAVAGLLEALVDRDVHRQEICQEEERAVDEAKQWLRSNGGKGIPHEEVLAEFGLTADDFLRLGQERAERRA